MVLFVCVGGLFRNIYQGERYADDLTKSGIAGGEKRFAYVVKMMERNETTYTPDTAYLLEGSWCDEAIGGKAGRMYDSQVEADARDF